VSAATAAAPEVRAAYRHCEQVTKAQARNFSYGIVLLPGDKRRALSAVYAFARRIDDIGDGVLAPDDKLAKLSAARDQIMALAGGPDAAPAPSADPVLVALADAASRFPIPLAAFGELIEGCEADVRGTAYLTFSDLEHYCRCVAGSIGRLSLGVFGTRDPSVAAPLADALGVALQLTNILRDIREDLRYGRVYLPADDLARFGCTLEPGGPGLGGSGAAGSGAAGSGAAGPGAAGPGPAGPGAAGSGAGEPAGDDQWLGETSGLEQVIRFEAERARAWYTTGLQLMPMLDRRSAASAGAMAGIYLRLLQHIAAAPGTALQRRMSLPTSEKLMVAVRSLAGLSPRPAIGGAA
jgi:phytoene synthase